jgi:hypothetical protein
MLRYSRAWSRAARWRGATASTGTLRVRGQVQIGTSTPTDASPQRQLAAVGRTLGPYRRRGLNASRFRRGASQLARPARGKRS